MSYGLSFVEANDGLMAIVKSNMLDTDFYVFINFDEVLYNGVVGIRVKYKCAKTNNIFSNYPHVATDEDIKYLMNLYKDFVDSLKALDRIYSTVLEEFVNSCAS